MAKRVIVPLVCRHAEDAAFYWSQHDAFDSVPGRDLSSLAHFSNLLAAHLEGLEVASHHGSELALAALEAAGRSFRRRLRGPDGRRPGTS